MIFLYILSCYDKKQGGTKFSFLSILKERERENKERAKASVNNGQYIRLNQNLKPIAGLRRWKFGITFESIGGHWRCRLETARI